MEFTTARPVSGARFWNRDEALEVLLRDVEAMGRHAPARWFSLFGQRKSGKTSLLYELSRRLSGTALVCMVDCWRVRAGVVEFSRLLATGLLDRYIGDKGLASVIGLPGRARSAAALGEVLGAARARGDAIVLEGLELLRDLSSGDLSAALLDGLVDLPQRIAEVTSAPVVVALDEFQELAKISRPRRGGLSGNDLYAVLRSRWQTHDRVMYLVAGSRMTALRKIVSDDQAPFFQHFTALDVGAFSIRVARDLLRTQLVASGTTASEDVLRGILHTIGTLPFYVQVVGATLVDVVGNGEAEQADARRALDRCLFQQNGTLNLFFRNQFERLVGRSGALAQVMMALVEPLSLGQLAERMKVASGAAATYVRRLVEDDAVERDAEGRYRVSDRCFRLWIRSQEDLGARSAPSLVGDESERRVTEALAALGFRVIYQSRASRGAFDLLGLIWGNELAVQVKTGDPPTRIAASDLRRMQHEAQRMGWIPVLATVGDKVVFYDLAAVLPARRKSLSFGRDVAPTEDLLALLPRG